MDMEEYLAKFRLRDPDAGLKDRLLSAIPDKPPASKYLPLRPSWAVAATILVGLSVGVFWLAVGARSPSSTLGPVEELAGITFLNGQARVLPLGRETRFTILDATRGEIRLDEGEIYLELPADGRSHVEIQTPARTALAFGPRLFAQYREAAVQHLHALLAVAVLSGGVEVSNPFGHAAGDTGDVVLAEQGSAPEKHSDGSALSQYHGGCPFANALGLVYRAEVQLELRLTEAQRARLQAPGKDELEQMCRFFRDLRTVPRAEWAAKASAFSHAQHEKIAAVLSAEQQQRLRQISLQQEGLFALIRPEVADELHLDDQQRRTVETQLKELGTAFRELQTQDVPPKEMIRRLAELRQQTSTKLSTALSVAQREQWQKMLGNPFPLPPSFHQQR